MDIINGWPEILSRTSGSDEGNGKGMPIVVNTKTAVFITAQAVMGPIIAIPGSASSFVFESEPLSLYAASVAVGLIPQESHVPSLVWKLLLWPLDLLMYLVPLF